MNTLKPHIFNVCMLISCASTLQAKTMFEDFEEEMNSLHTHMIENMNRMTARMEQCFNQIHTMQAQPTSAQNMMQQTGITMNDLADGIEIEAAPITATKDNFEATVSFDENSIMVPTASGVLTIQINYPYVRASFYHKTNNKESAQKEHTYHSTYSTQMVKTITKEVDLAHVRVKCTEHDAKGRFEHTLKVKLPFKEKAVAKIPITVEKHCK